MPSTRRSFIFALVSAVCLVGSVRLQAQTPVDIDTPNTQSLQTFLGTVTFSGWTFDTSFGVASVSVAIDGVSRGNATYGIYRPDVCSAGAHPNCPYVGWNLSVDTAMLSAGSHSVSVTTNTNDGRHVSNSTTFKVTAAWTPVVIDTPNTSTAYLGTVNFGGWSYDTANPISSVAITIDGVSKGNAIYGNSRPDVCSAGSNPGCPNVGWTLSVDTALLSGGTHTIVATSTTTDGRTANISKTFTVTAAWTPVIIDTPNTTTSYLGTINFAGWSYDTANPISSVSVAVDGVSKGNATYGTSRPDACAAGSNPGCPNVGWYLAVDTALLSAGTHTVVATSTTSDGRTANLSRTFTVTAAWTPVIIDAPASTGSYVGPVTFAGWTYDTANPISSVGITIDGVSKGNASYGISRPDACASGVAPGCPNVGWNLVVDTSLLSVGTHTVVAKSNTSDGRSANISKTFMVAAPQTLATIDYPVSSGGGDYSLSGTFSGWALDNGYPISSVSVIIDGASQGNATYGVNRPDVCAAGTKPGCPNVGWTFNYGPLATGYHTFSIKVTTTDNRTVSTPNVRFLATASVTSTTPKKEYIYLNGKVIAIENHP